MSESCDNCGIILLTEDSIEKSICAGCYINNLEKENKELKEYINKQADQQFELRQAILNTYASLCVDNKDGAEKELLGTGCIPAFG